MTCRFQILYIQNINKAHFVEKSYKSNIIKHLCIIHDASGLGKESFLCTKYLGSNLSISNIMILSRKFSLYKLCSVSLATG